MRKKRTWIIILCCLVVLFVGVKWVYNTVIHRAANQISAELAKPEVEQAINQLKEQYLSNKEQYVTSDSTTRASESSNKEDKEDIENKNDKDKVEFKSQDDALKFVVSRVSVSDIKYVKEITSEGLTEENKEKLQEIALEKFTSEEIEAVLEALQ